jgi:biopolymer transport protein ExbD
MIIIITIIMIIRITIIITIIIIEGSLEVKLPTIWTDEKQSREEAERRGRLEERRVEEKE